MASRVCYLWLKSFQVLWCPIGELEKITFKDFVPLAAFYSPTLSFWHLANDIGLGLRVFKFRQSKNGYAKYITEQSYTISINGTR